GAESIPLETVMKQSLRFSLRSGLVAAGLAAVLATPAWAGPSQMALPIGSAGSTAPAAAQPAIGNADVSAEIIKVRNRHYKRHYKPRRHAHRHRHHRHYRGPIIGFSLGIVPAYRYYAPPRRVYRYGLPQAHYDWCYDRW